MYVTYKRDCDSVRPCARQSRESESGTADSQDSHDDYDRHNVNGKLVPGIECARVHHGRHVGHVDSGSWGVFGMCVSDRWLGSEDFLDRIKLNGEQSVKVAGTVRWIDCERTLNELRSVTGGELLRRCDEMRWRCLRRLVC